METGEVNKVKHLGDMFHYVPKSRADICPVDNDANLTRVPNSDNNQSGVLSKEDRDIALEECRKRCGIVPGKMTVPRLRTAPEPEQEWQKWTSEEREKAFDEWV